MAKLTPKENFLRLAKGEIPESVPLWSMGRPGFNGESMYLTVGPFIFPRGGGPDVKPGDKFIDAFGIGRVANAETGFQYLPEPGNFILKDITKWHEVIKHPIMPDIGDWEKKAKADWEQSGIDYTKSAAAASFTFVQDQGPFQFLMAAMGFTEGLMAMYEEPEHVKELLHYICDFFVPIIEKTVEHYTLDAVYYMDDTATRYNPFISVEMFRDILKPVYARLFQPAVNRGLPIMFHNCGRCEDFFPDMVELGVRMSDPMQVDNDLLGIKATFGSQLVICGGYQYPLTEQWPQYDEEVLRQSVRDTIDSLAPNGGFAFSGGPMGAMGDETAPIVRNIIMEEAYNYGLDYYNR